MVQGCAQLGFEYLQWWNHHNLTWETSSCAVFDQPQSKNYFLHLKGIFYISFNAHSFLSCHWALLRRAWLCVLHSLPVGVWMHWQEPAQNSPSFLSLSSHLQYLKPLKTFMASCWAHCRHLCPLCAEESRTWHNTAYVVCTVLNRKEASNLSACWQFCS